jgi:hypothetical protein
MNENMYTYHILEQLNIPLERNDENEGRTNPYGMKLLDLCRRCSLFMWKIYRLKCKFYRLKCKIYRLKCKFYRLKCKFYRLKCKIYRNGAQTWQEWCTGGPLQTIHFWFYLMEQGGHQSQSYLLNGTNMLPYVVL